MTGVTLRGGQWLDRCIVTCDMCQTVVYAVLHVCDLNCLDLCGPCFTKLAAVVPADAGTVALKQATSEELMAEAEEARRER